MAEAGNARSEIDHGYTGENATTGAVDGKSFRQARGWMRYALTVFDDTEVTVACAFLGGNDAPLTYDLLVEDQLVATRTFAAGQATPTVAEFSVPFAITKGKTNILVTIRARAGMTPALFQLRTIQDHLENDRSFPSTLYNSHTP